MDSIWTKTVQRPKFDALPGEVKTDVVVIGGGMAGVLCAHMLKAAGVDCLLVEAATIGGGITQNTTAKLTLQHGLIYDKLLRKLGAECAAMYWRIQQEAMEQYRLLCADIPCDYEVAPSYVYSRTDRAKLEYEAAAIGRIGGEATFVEHVSLPISTVGAVRVPAQAQFHPLKFLYALARALPIFEHTRVLELRQGSVLTDRGIIRCQNVIVATHFPFLNKHGAYFLKLYQHRSYVLAMQGGMHVDGMYVDEDEKGLSFRQYGDCLLLGGGSHRTGKKGGGWRELSAFTAQYNPTATEVARWATQDCMTLDGLAYIGPYSRHTPQVYVATGFNKWGMTSSMVAAMLLTDLVQGKRNEYAPLFSPSRSIMHPQLAINAAESLLGLLTPTVPRCPHLGCALKYNKQEHSWDCPCHGSRFDANGALIDNPATGDHKKITR